MKYFLIHNLKDVFLYGEIQEEQKISTIQPYVEYFETEANLVKRLVELNQTYVKKVLSNSREGIDNVQPSTPNIDLSLDEFED